MGVALSLDNFAQSLTLFRVILVQHSGSYLKGTEQKGQESCQLPRHGDSGLLGQTKFMLLLVQLFWANTNEYSLTARGRQVTLFMKLRMYRRPLLYAVPTALSFSKTAQSNKEDRMQLKNIRHVFSGLVDTINNKIFSHARD